MSADTHARLDARRRDRGESKARLAERLIDEGLRMEMHPGIVFRDGPAGRRAALVEIDDWIAANREEAEKARAACERAQAALA